jgi:ABC-2 type transport system permease protein
MKPTLSITRKELDSYFGSPMALIFVGVFLAATLFAFFWGAAFFTRGIADVRPLFQGMPILMIFLIGALTMRQWSEEQQTGTLEVLLTMPVRLAQLVIGKFVAVMALVAVALLLTLSLPITVGLLGNPDLGTIVGGYLAALLLAAAYVAIGLFISSLTDNQIVALILTVLICGLFYMIGTTTLTGLVNNSIADLLRALGTGSRFESVERGVVDLRDLLYYLSITVGFLALNVLSLERKRWGTGKAMRDFRTNRVLSVILVIANLVSFNVLAYRADGLRLDLTQSGQYTLSPVTRELLANLQEPLLIRGYISQKTHPLLDPLIPQVRDLLREYEIAAGGKLTVEFIDPITNPTLESEANQTYGIRSRPLQVNDRGGTAVINAYLSILFRYGDQNSVVNLLDIIDINTAGNQTTVSFRNLEYDLTSTLQRVVYGFQNIDAVLAGLPQPAKLTLYVTPQTLPESLKTAPDTIKTVANDLVKRGKGKLQFVVVDGTDPNLKLDPNALRTKYQIEPIPVGFLSNDTFYLHMVLELGTQSQVIFPSGQVSEAETRSSIESAVKRVAPGFLQVVGVWTPVPDVNQGQQGQPQSLQQFQSVLTSLRQSYDVRSVNLTNGTVPPEINALVIIAPQNMTDTERYAVDQYLMRGGAVFVAESNYRLMIGADGSLILDPVKDGLADMLASYGVGLGNTLVLDTQNSPFPIQVPRTVNGTTVQEIQSINYPHFVNIRQNGMDTSGSLMAGLQAITLNYASPLNLTVATDEKAGRTVTALLKSTANSWVTTDTNIEPNMQLYANSGGFPVGSERGSQVLAVAIRGSFSSFFKGKQSPLVAPVAPAAPTPTGAAPGTPAASPTPSPTPRPESQSFVPDSPSSSRLIVVGSAEFLNDNILNLAQRYTGDQTAFNGVQFVTNSVDYFTQDSGLASIRARSTANRLLRPLQDGEQTRWEIFNYVFALVALGALALLWQFRKRSERPMKLLPPSEPTDAANAA